MEGYIRTYNKGKERKIHPTYDRLWKRYGIKSALPYDDPSYRRMHYVRYADDFIITIIGPKSEAVEIKNNCANFLNDLKLTLNQTLITNPKTKDIPFLGYLIKKSPKKKYSTYGGKVAVLRGGQIYLKADFRKVVKRLNEKGFCLKNGYPVPNFSLLNETQYGTIRKVSKILRGLASYYTLARNYRDFMSRTNYIIRYSTAKLFAAKFKYSSISKIFARAGKNLSRPISNKTTKTKKSVIGQRETKIYAYKENEKYLEDRNRNTVNYLQLNSKT